MKTEKWIKYGSAILAALFAVITVIALLSDGQTDRLLLAIVTVFLVMLPAAMEKVLRCRINLGLYIFALLYSIGPMLGHCWYFYYTISWWDKLLHICGGVMFAIVGAYIFDRLSKGTQNHLIRAIFALCFSMAVAVLWEFFEFSADRLLGMDMQDDTLVTGLTSYLLGDSIGVTGNISDILSVTVNGIALPGYIDIGLIDSMMDMLLESIGALITGILLFFDKDRHPLIQNDKGSAY